MTFKHAGEPGDIIYSAPVIRALGGGTLCLHAERWTREPMTEAKVQSIRSLLITQPYIEDVRWLKPGESVDVNLNDFRAAYFRDFKNPDFPKQRNLCEWILRTHGCDPDEQDKQWLKVEPIRAFPVIVNRTGFGRKAHHVYRNRQFPWRNIVEKYVGNIAFVGTPVEYSDFCMRFGEIPRICTPDLVTLAHVIAGADLFIGNQSCAYAIAEGLKKPAILEVCPWLPNCLFFRENVIHGWSADIDLPPLNRSDGQNVSGESEARSVLAS